MRVLVLIKANQDSENGIMPSEKLLTEMTDFNEELVRAGIMQSGEGLHPSSRGKRVQFKSDGSSTVLDGPFSETKELIAGFWIWKVNSIDEAVEWVKKVPVPDDIKASDEGIIEIRPIFEAEDFGAELTPELRAREDAMRRQIEGQQS